MKLPFRPKTSPIKTIGIDSFYQRLLSIIATTDDPEMLLTQSCELLSESPLVDSVWVGVFQEEGALRPITLAGKEWDPGLAIQLAEEHPKNGPNPFKKCVETSQPQSLHVPVLTAKSGPLQHHFAEHNLTSNLFIPLVTEGSVEGVLGIHSVRVEVFGHDEIELLRDFASILTATYRQRKRLGLLQQQVEGSVSIRELTEELVTETNTSTFLKTLVERATHLLASSSGGMYLCEPESRQVRCVVSYRTIRDFTGVILRYGEGAAGVVAESGQPLIIDDYRTWPNRAEVYEEEQPFQEVLSAPMTWRGEVTGVLMVMRETAGLPFTQQDLELLHLFANQASITLRNTQLVENTLRQIRQSEILNNITRSALSAQDLETTTQNLAEQLKILIEADTCLIARWDEERGVPILGAVEGTKIELPDSEMPQPGESTLVGSALQARKPLAVEDLAKSAFVSPRIAAILPFHSVLSVPLIRGDHLLGAALIGFNEQHHFTDEEISISEQAGRVVALALGSAEAFDTERRHGAELEALREASLKLTSTLDLDAVFDAILEHALKLVNAKDAHIFLYDGESLAFGSALWADHRHRRPYSEPRQHGLTYRIARTGKRLVVPDASEDPLYADMPFHGAIVGFPLMVGNRILGVMNVAFDHPRSFEENELRLLELLADQASIAIENANLYKQAISEQQVVQFLFDITRTLTSTFDRQSILQRATELTAASTGGFICDIFLHDPETDRLILYASAGLDHEAVIEKDRVLDMSIGKGLVGWAADKRKPFLVDDVQLDSRWVTIVGIDDEAHSAVGAPIIAGEDFLGYLSVFHHEVGLFTEDHEDQIVSICNQIALALTNSDRFQLITRQLAELKVIQEVANVVNRRLGMEALLSEVVMQVRDILGCPVVEIFLVEGDQLVQKSSYGVEPAEYLRIPISQGVLGRVARTNIAEFIPDVREDPDYIQGPPESRVEIAVPLHKGDVVIGVLNLESPDPNDLSSSDVSLVSLLADQVSVAIENAALYDRLQRHMVELERTVEDRTAELAEALQQAQEADRLKTEFISDVSHELRTPLSNIRLYLDLLVDGHTAKFEDYLDTLNRETDRLVDLIEDLLAISRLDAGTAAPRAELLAFNGLVRVLIEDRLRLCNELNLDLSFEAHPNLPAIRGDPHMLSQAVANVLTNAMNFTPPGGKIILNSDVEELNGLPWVTLRVEDTGLGISEEDQKHIFERFFRGEASREVDAPGTGLGLSITKEILEAHAGRITFTSNKGEGTTFTLWLPSAEITSEVS